MGRQDSHNGPRTRRRVRSGGSNPVPAPRRTGRAPVPPASAEPYGVARVAPYATGPRCPRRTGRCRRRNRRDTQRRPVRAAARSRARRSRSPPGARPSGSARRAPPRRPAGAAGPFGVDIAGSCGSDPAGRGLLAAVLFVVRPGPVDRWLAGDSGTHPERRRRPPSRRRRRCWPRPVRRAPHRPPPASRRRIASLVNAPALGSRVNISIVDAAPGEHALRREPGRPDHARVDHEARHRGDGAGRPRPGLPAEHPRRGRRRAGRGRAHRRRRPDPGIDEGPVPRRGPARQARRPGQEGPGRQQPTRVVVDTSLFSGPDDRRRAGTDDMIARGAGGRGSRR